MDFKLTVKKENYTEGSNIVNTYGDKLTIKADVILTMKEEKISPKMEVGEDLGKIVGFDPIYFDFHKYAYF